VRIRAAAGLAADIPRNREQDKAITENPLQPPKREKDRKEG